MAATAPASAVTVEELTGSKRKVELVGAGLPFAGAEWSGTMNVVTQWNAGNAEATQQVLGPQEMPSAWEGEWNTTRLISRPCSFSENGGAAQTVVYANTLVEIFDAIRRGGQPLRVTWSTESVILLENGTEQPRRYKVTRRGRLTEFGVNFDRMDDVRWRMQFDWSGRGEQQRRILKTKGEDVVALSRAAVVVANEAVGAVERPAIRSTAPSTFRLGDLEAFVDAPLALVDDFARSANALSARFKQVGDLIVATRELPAAIAGRAVDVATNAISVANQFTDEMSREGPEAQDLRSTVSNLMRAASYYSGTQRGAERLSDVSIEYAAAVRRKRAQNARGGGLGTSSSQSKVTASEILAIHVPRRGETFYSISVKYYDEDLSAELARANGFPSYQLEPGRIPVVVPSRAVLDVRSKDRV